MPRRNRRELSGDAQSLCLQAAHGGSVELSFPDPGDDPAVSQLMIDANVSASPVPSRLAPLGEVRCRIIPVVGDSPAACATSIPVRRKSGTLDPCR